MKSSFGLSPSAGHVETSGGTASASALASASFPPYTTRPPAADRASSRTFVSGRMKYVSGTHITRHFAPSGMVKNPSFHEMRVRRASWVR